MRMRRSESPSKSVGFPSASNRSLSQASEAFETSSRRKISRFEYSEWIIKPSSSLTSAWKPSVSRVARGLDVSVMMSPKATRRMRRYHGAQMSATHDVVPDNTIEMPDTGIRRPPWVAALLLWLAGNGLRLTILAVPPVIAMIRDDLHLSATEVGLLKIGRA